MRLIDADALIDEIKHGLWDWGSVDGIKSSAVLKQTISDINNMPTVDAEPIKHGMWIGKPMIGGYSRMRCSVCDNVFLENKGKWSYCPCCGAKMDEDEISNIAKESADKISKALEKVRANGDADVVGLPFIHIECKRVERLNLYDAMAQIKEHDYSSVQNTDPRQQFRGGQR